jgi:hypothetical protein
MTMFRTKGEPVEAVQFRGWAESEYDTPLDPWPVGWDTRGWRRYIKDSIRLDAWDGPTTVAPGDWIVRANGRWYAMTDEDFAATYEPAAPATPSAPLDLAERVWRELAAALKAEGPAAGLPPTHVKAARDIIHGAFIRLRAAPSREEEPRPVSPSTGARSEVDAQPHNEKGDQE